MAISLIDLGGVCERPRRCSSTAYLAMVRAKLCEHKDLKGWLYITVYFANIHV